MPRSVVAIWFLFVCAIAIERSEAHDQRVAAWFRQFHEIRTRATLTLEEKHRGNAALLYMLSGSANKNQRMWSKTFLMALKERYRIAANQLAALHAPRGDLAVLSSSYAEFYSASAELCDLCLKRRNDLCASGVMSELWTNKNKLEALGRQFDINEDALRTKYGIARN